MSIEALFSLLVYVIIVGAVCWLLWWLVSFIGVPEPFAKVARGIIAVVAVFFLINVLLSFVGHPLVRLR